MESLGKEKNLDGEIVHQGIAVYGNKGSTDQHSYVQQLRDGVLNFFVTFIEVRKDRRGERLEVEDGVTSGDYLQGFLRGTRSALYESGRESITISIPEVNAFNLGALIALYERAVGFYGSLVNINAYDQPGVEAGKKGGDKAVAASKTSERKTRRRSGENRRRNCALHRRRSRRCVSRAAALGKQRSAHQGRAWRGTVARSILAGKF
jgi:glucose-6-phosphate isomerase